MNKTVVSYTYKTQMKSKPHRALESGFIPTVKIQVFGEKITSDSLIGVNTESKTRTCKTFKSPII